MRTYVRVSRNLTCLSARAEEEGKPMSNIVKVFIVLNFVLSVVFVATIATLLGKADNWKQKYTELDDTTKQQITALKEDKSRLTGELGEKERARQAAVDEKEDVASKFTSSEQQLTEKKRDYEKLNNNLAELKEKFGVLSGALKQAQTDRETYERRMTTAEEKARTSVSSKEVAEDDSRRLQTQIEQLKDNIASLERDLTDTRKNLAHKETLVKIAIDQGFNIDAAINTPAIEAVVQKVDSDLKFVMLSVGGDDRVSKGMRFHISRNGTYVGEVRVDYVYPKSCSASFVMLKDGMNIQAGDSAATRL